MGLFCASDVGLMVLGTILSGSYWEAASTLIRNMENSAILVIKTRIILRRKLG